MPPLCRFLRHALFPVNYARHAGVGHRARRVTKASAAVGPYSCSTANGTAVGFYYHTNTNTRFTTSMIVDAGTSSRY